MKLFVTGGAGFIGSELRPPRARERPTTRSRSSTRSPTPATSRTSPTSTTTRASVRARATSATATPCDGDGRPRRASSTSRPRATSTAPSSDPDEFVRTNCVGTNVCATAAAASASSRRSCTSPPTRSTARSTDGSFDRDATRSSPARRTRRRRPAPTYRPVLPRDLRPAGRRHPVVEQLRAVPVPREGHPALRHQPARGPQVPLYGDGLNMRDWLFVDDNCRASTSCCAGRIGEIYNIGAGNETPNREITDELLAALGQATSSRRVRGRPPGPRPPLLDRHAKVAALGLGAAASTSTRPSRRPSSGTATTAGGGSRSRRAVDETDRGMI